MRLRINHLPTVAELDGTRIDRYRIGLVYDLPTRIANVFLAEGWAEPLREDAPQALPKPHCSSILVVDDDAEMRAIAADLLSVTGRPIVTAKNGREALQLLRDSRPALVLLDLMMPVMDGWQFRAAQQRLSDPYLATVPIVLLTAAANPEKHRRELDAADVIAKPIDLDELIAIVCRWLRE